MKTTTSKATETKTTAVMGPEERAAKLGKTVALATVPEQDPIETEEVKDEGATLLNVLTALTLIVPVTVSADEMDARDVADARDAWDFFFDGTPGGNFYPCDGRKLRHW